MRMRFFIVLVILLCLCQVGLATITYGTNLKGLYKSFYIQPPTGGFVVNGLAFDPTSQSPDGYYNKVYWVNQVDYVGTGPGTLEGLYYADIYEETYSGRLALGQMDKPQAAVVDTNGDVYALSSGSFKLYKIVGASSGSPVVTQMLGNYAWNTSGSPSDDDPISIGMLPPNFGGSYNVGQDLVLFDCGFDINEEEGVAVIDKNSSVEDFPYNQIYNIIYHDGSTSSNSDIRGVVNYYDGFAYFVRTAIPSDNPGSGTKAYINRVKADGILQRVYMNVGGTIPAALDDAITANPADGSVWIYVNNYNGVSGDRALYRIDAANATLISDANYQANTTVEMVRTGSDYINLSKNDMAFSPDGVFLVLATGDSRDKMYVYSTQTLPLYTKSITYGSYVNGLYKSFYAVPQADYGSYTIAGLAFDPTSISADGRYDRIYWANRVDDTSTQGLWSASVYTGTYQTFRVALTSYENMNGCVVDANGDVYTCSSEDEGVWKVVNPTDADNHINIQMLGNYDLSGDDDPIGIALVPPGFGGGFEAGKDLILFDAGVNDNNDEAVFVVDSESLYTGDPITQLYTYIWSDQDATSNDIHGAASIVDGFAYFARTIIPSDESGSGAKYYINRLKVVEGETVLQRVFINIGGGTIDSNTLDDSVTVNPVDGSVWMAVKAADSNDRIIYRLDAVNATLISGDDYMANATAEIVLSSPSNVYNIGLSDLAFSPDGLFLAVGTPSGRDIIYVFSTQAIPAEPVNCADAIGKGYSLSYDFNDDCRVNFKDFAEFATEWLDCVDPTESNCP